jgi:hypothetical protein
VHVFCIANAALDDTDVAGAAVFDVGDRRAVEFNEFQQGEQALVNVEYGHVTSEATG